MFRKLVDLFRRQQASAKKPIVEPSSINAHEKKKPTAKLAPTRLGRPIHKRPAPNKPGIYIIKSKRSGKRRYIGAAKNLKKRQAEHKRSGKFDPYKEIFVFQPAKDFATAAEIYEHEKKKIKKHQPPKNQRGGGAGPRWKPVPSPEPEDMEKTKESNVTKRRGPSLKPEER